MAMDLTTGVPGAGKTLYTVAEVLRPLVGKTIEHAGRQVPRRLMIAGIPDLLLPHELVEVQKIDPEGYKDQWADHKRDPGDPPLDVPVRGDNWWLWCMPGDVIVIDECQRLFRPFAAGRKVPEFIAKLETHRHYGVDFVLITQHPQLLHTNVRNLIGRHQHVRRLWGGRSTLVYEWDHCTHPDKVRTAITKHWRHKKAAFGLYKSAEVHTKPKGSIPLPLFVMVGALIALPCIAGYAFVRTKHRFEAPTPVAAVQASAASKSAAPVTAGAAAPTTPAAVQASPAPKHYAGCMASAHRCVCVTDDGTVEDANAMCHDSAREYGHLVKLDMTFTKAPVWAPAPSRPTEQGVAQGGGSFGFDAGDYRQRDPVARDGSATPIAQTAHSIVYGGGSPMPAPGG